MFYRDERLALFIDGSNLYAAAKSLGFDIDYKLLRAEFMRRGKMVRAFYYTALLENDEYSPIRPLVDWLNYNGFTMVTKPAKEYTDSMGRRKVKGNMDIELAVDAMELAPFVDHIVIFSGDGDFRPLVEALQRKGVRVSVVSTIRSQPPMISDELRRQADNFIELEELRDENLAERRVHQGFARVARGDAADVILVVQDEPRDDLQQKASLREGGTLPLRLRHACLLDTSHHLVAGHGLHVRPEHVERAGVVARDAIGGELGAGLPLLAGDAALLLLGQAHVHPGHARREQRGEQDAREDRRAGVRRERRLFLRQDPRARRGADGDCPLEDRDSLRRERGQHRRERRGGRDLGLGHRVVRDATGKERRSAQCRRVGRALELTAW